MNINLNMEIGKKKAVYPSKKTINLFYQEDKSTQFSTIALDVLFVVVVVLGLAKLLVVDVLAERNAAWEKLETAQVQLEQKMDSIADYDEVSDEYARFSYTILVDAETNQDRMDVLKMLEQTVYLRSEVSNVSIVGNVVSLSFTGLDLNGTAKLIQEIQSYDMVSDVKINNQNGTDSGTYSGNMVITLVEKKAGGKQ